MLVCFLVLIPLFICVFLVYMGLGVLGPSLFAFLCGVRASSWIRVWLQGRDLLRLGLDWLPGLLNTIQSGSARLLGLVSAIPIQPPLSLPLVDIRVVLPDGWL
jgi:hypothetical protein